MIRIILTDDHKLIRDGIKSLILEEQSIDVIGEAANGEELLALLAQQETDLVVLDINMPVMDGFEAMRIIREKYPQVKIIVLTMLDHENYVIKMMDAGAHGYILKNTGQEELIYAIRMVANGQRYLGMDIAFNLLDKIKQMQSKSTHTVNREANDLSKRELEVLQLIADGLTSAEIAEKLFTSKRTVESHRQNLLEKTQCNNTATLIKYALSKGLIQSQ